MGQLFVLCTNRLKYQNNLLSTKYSTTYNLFNTLNYCSVLFYLVLSYTVVKIFIFCKSKRSIDLDYFVFDLKFENGYSITRYYWT
jgi:hypothetical protein